MTKQYPSYPPLVFTLYDPIDVPLETEPVIISLLSFPICIERKLIPELKPFASNKLPSTSYVICEYLLTDSPSIVFEELLKSVKNETASSSITVTS